MSAYEDAGFGEGSRGCGISFGLDMSAPACAVSYVISQRPVGCSTPEETSMVTDLGFRCTYKVHTCRLKLMGLFLARRTSLPHTGYLNSRTDR